MSQQESLERYKSAITRISGLSGEPGFTDFAESVSDLKAAGQLMPGALAKLAVFTAMGAGTRKDDDQAKDLFLRAALSGMPPLVRELGALVLFSGVDEGLAGTLLKRAASGGDWIAGFLIAREAMNGRAFLPKNDLLKIAGSFSKAVPFYQQISKSINGLSDGITLIPNSTFSTDKCREAVNAVAKNASAPKSKTLASTPLVKSLGNVLSPTECDYLIAISCGAMQPSKVVNANKGDSFKTGYRTSDGTVLLPHMLDFPGLQIVQKLSAAAHISPENGEFLSLLRYRPGQEYYPHHDYLEQDDKDYSKVKISGQRCATLLTYLNDGYEGGATEFPKLDVQYQGKVGSSLYFQNTDSSGDPLPNSLHAGLPVQDGEKWLATLWIREKPFWPWVRN